MRVLQLFRSLRSDIGGPLSYLRAVAAASPEGVTSEVAVFDSLPSTFELDLVHSADAKPLALTLWLARNLRRYDVVHIHGIFGWHFMVGGLLCAWLRIPCVVNAHGLLMPAALAEKPAKKSLYLKLIGRRMMRRAAAVVAASELERAAIAQVEPAARVMTIYPGQTVPVDSGSRAVPSAERLLYLGRIHPHKQLHVLLEALNAIRTPDWSLSIVGAGSGPYETELRDLVAQLGFGGRVAFRGFLEGKAKDRELSGAMVLVMPSRSENFSFAVAEALVHGVPVVTTEGVGMAELVRRYRCGEVVPSGNAQALASAIDRVCDTRRNAEASQRALVCAQEQLSLVRMRAELSSLYRGLQT